MAHALTLSPRRALAALAAVASVGALAVAAPQAPAAQADATACGQEFGQPFLPWNDKDHYTLAEGGDFETGGAGWTFTGDARIVEDGLDQRGGGADRHALHLDAGGAATTPPVCVTDAHRTIRFFHRLEDRGGQTGDQLRVEMIYRNNGGREKVVRVADLTPSASAWGPSRILKLDTSKFYTDLSDPTAIVQFRLTARYGSVRVDDVFVDPRLR